MSEYINRELASKRLTSYAKGIDETDTFGAMLRAIISDIPAADVRPVVLCKECKYAYDSVGGWCCSHGICVDCIVREYFFCADGEKKEES